MTIALEIQRLREGDVGQHVRKMQLLLNFVQQKPEDVDGEFGPLTLEAVKEFQGTYNLPITGIFDEPEWEKLLNLPVVDAPG